jgi:hypothetical protein
MNIQEVKHFFDWVDAQCNKDGFVTIAEMIKACTPDIDNNGQVNVVTYVDSKNVTHIFDELEIGTKNANIWLAKLPTSVMQDQKMSFDEYYAYFTAC